MEGFRDLGNPILNAEDVSNAILYVLSTPPHVQVRDYSPEGAEGFEQFFFRFMN